VLHSASGSKHITHRLVHLDKPLFRIPTLAIHLDRTQNEAFKFNRETEYRPIAGLIEQHVNSTPATPATDVVEESPVAARHHPELLSFLAETVAESVESIKDFELVLYDTQPPCLGGYHDEFIFAPRLDNLCMSFCAVKAIEESRDLESDETVRLISLFDHEVLLLEGVYLISGNRKFDCSWG
jgi:aspartyl aminopeptidase